MNEVEYVFNSDIKDKKKGLSGARGMKRGSKSKKCTLPSDYLTASQKKKLNGEVKTYKMKEPITWEEFKSMPREHKETYIDYMVATYHVSAVQLAEMMGVVPNTLGKYLREIELNDHLLGRGHKMSKKQLDTWEKFLNEHRTAGKNIQKSKRDESYYQKAEEKLVPHKTPEVSSSALPSSLNNISFEMSGNVDLNQVYAYALSLVGKPEFKGKITVMLNFT